MIDLDIYTQPDDETCGPTCLHAIYRYYGLSLGLDEVIASVERSLSGGTLASMLGKDALMRDFRVTIYVSNVDVFDPTWFKADGRSERELLMAKLEAQKQFKSSPAMIQASSGYQAFLQLGGNIYFRTVSVSLLKSYFVKKTPVLAGLSATYLYRSARERFTPEGVSLYDDIRGMPCGHFVVLRGYDDAKRHMVVADPHRENPLSHENYYKVSSNRLINAIMLGVLTYDANLLIIERKDDECTHSL